MYRKRSMVFLVAIILLTTTRLTLAAKKPSRSIYFISSKVSFNSKYLQDHQLITKNTTVDVILNVAQNFPYDPWALVVIARKNRKTNDYTTLFQYDVNICNVLGKDGPNFLTVMLQNFLKYGNLPKSCPILKGNYWWSDLKVDKLNIPDFLPSARYKFNIHTYFSLEGGRETLANVTMFVLLK